MTTNEVHTYLWYESQASGGPDEIASCLKYYFEQQAPDRPKAIMYSVASVSKQKYKNSSRNELHCEK